MEIIEMIRTTVPAGTVIPKPDAKGEFTVKGWGKRRGQDALIYNIPNHSNPQHPYNKGITLSEFEVAYAQLMSTGEFSRAWFNTHLSECAKEGDCNFTTIGGVFKLLGIADYDRAVYRRI